MPSVTRRGRSEIYTGNLAHRREYPDRINTHSKPPELEEQTAGGGGGGGGGVGLTGRHRDS